MTGIGDYLGGVSTQPGLVGEVRNEDEPAHVLNRTQAWKTGFLSEVPISEPSTRSINLVGQLGWSTGSINWVGQIHQVVPLCPPTGPINWIGQLGPSVGLVNWVGQLGQVGRSTGYQPVDGPS